MQSSKENILPRRPTLLNTSLGVVLAILIVAAVNGVDLQHELLRVLYPLLENTRYYWTILVVREPSSLIASAPLNQPIFGWPTCIIILITIGMRSNFRKTTPILTTAATCLFTYLIVGPVFETIPLSFGWYSRGNSIINGKFPIAVSVITCNLCVTGLLWRWTRSRVVLIGFILLSIFGPLILWWAHLAPNATAFDDENSFAYKLVLIKQHLMHSNEIVLESKPNGMRPLFGGPTNIPIFSIYISTYFCIVFNSIALLLLLWPTIFMRIKPNQCTKCKYDRTGIASDAPCPECGDQPISPTTAKTSAA